MGFSRAEMKGQARRLISDSKNKVILVGAVYIVLGVVISLLTSSILNFGMTENDIVRYDQYIESGSIDRAMQLLEQFMPSYLEQFMALLLNMVYSIVTVGWYIFLLNVLRNLGSSFGNLLDGFAFFWRIILLNIVEAVLIGLWSTLFVIPGIIAAYRYKMAIYVLIDNPNMSVMGCIRVSKAMTAGHKGELFMLDLSFIGWSLLTFIPIVGYLAQLWITPYIDMTYVIFYDRLKTQTGTSQVLLPDGWNG